VLRLSAGRAAVLLCSSSGRCTGCRNDSVESLRPFHVTYFLEYGQRAAKHVMESKKGKLM
jgi:hypothetical protein